MEILEFLNTMCVTRVGMVKTYVAHRQNYPMKIKSRWNHGFIFTISGTEVYHFNGLKLEAVPGSILYIPKGENYITTLKDDESVVIAVDFDLAGENPSPFVTRFSDHNSLNACFTKIEAVWKKKDVTCMPECKSLLYRIIELMARQRSRFLPSEKFSKIAGAVDYLHENYLKNDFRLEDLAQRSGISYRYFETLFRQKYGTTPKEYVLSMKIEKAKELLAEGLLIRDIAILLGYRDIYHFGKIFTAKTGYTPTEYRSNFH